jgi:hypothetical protein
MDDKGKVKMNALDFLKFELKRIYIKSLQKWDENILFSQKWNENLEKLGIARETLRKILPSSIKKQSVSIFPPGLLIVYMRWILLRKNGLLIF